MVSQEPGGATLDREFAIEGLTFKTEAWYQRWFGAARNFVVNKPLRLRGRACLELGPSSRAVVMGLAMLVIWTSLNLM